MLALSEPLPPQVKDFLQGHGAELIGAPSPGNQGLQALGDCFDAVMINTQNKIDRNLLNQHGRLRWVLRPGSGLDNIDLEECALRGIEVLSSPEANAPAVGEYCMGAALALLRNLGRAHVETAGGAWHRAANTGTALSTITVGIIGYGHTGQAFGGWLRGKAGRVLAHDKYKSGFGDEMITEASLAQIAAEADLLSLHLPLTAETHHYLSADFISAMARPFYLINSARGGIADGAAVLAALDSGKIKAAALDVLEDENIRRLQGEALAEYLALAGHPNAIITPHIAGWTQTGRTEIYAAVARKWQQAIAGTGPSSV